MKCKVCRQPAAIEIRRHHAVFCKTHFFEHMKRQVERTIHDLEMFESGERLLLGVSGGKDSLALWDILTDLGYPVDGVYIELGIGGEQGYSSESLQLAEQFAKDRDLNLQVVDLATEYGYTIPEAAAETRRVACSVCGLSKRYVLNRVAFDGGYDVLVMGHNLDDEAAVLMGNTLTWNVEYIGRQRPVLPATGEGLVRKVKPLLRIAERETAAYCVLKGIEYEVEECPMVGGNTGIRIKEWLNVMESQRPGTKQQFLFGFLDRVSDQFADAHQEQVELRECTRCGQPTTSDLCAFCRLQTRMADRG
ncbi:MAG: TIGR00269 family protein [Acidimicrobiia bacterium]|nr:TIGR00269 family protein [Acidimicrobiia bacterium]